MRRVPTPAATWLPFETRKDFWGTYTYDPKTGAFALQPDAQYHNYLPADLKPAGKARIDAQGRLILEGVWLGARPPAAAKAATPCGHIFGK